MANTELQAVHDRLLREKRQLEAQIEALTGHLAIKVEAIKQLSQHVDPQPVEAAKPEIKKP